MNNLNISGCRKGTKNGGCTDARYSDMQTVFSRRKYSHIS